MGFTQKIFNVACIFVLFNIIVLLSCDLLNALDLLSIVLFTVPSKIGLLS